MKNSILTPCRAALAASLLLALPAQADISFNGFASIRGTSFNSDSGGIPFNTLSEEGNFNFSDESLFAIQGSADLGSGLSATVQLMAEGINDFDVEAKWAYLSYDLADNHRLSAGRFANPIFFQSQYENVGYAHNFARLPTAVYIGFDFSTVEGIALDSSFDVGDNILETKVLFGDWSGTVGNSGFELADIVSVNATLSGDWWKVFAGGFTTDVSGQSGEGSFNEFLIGSLAPAAAAALQTGATQAEVDAFNNTVLVEDGDGKYWFAGFGIDYNNFIFDFEYADYGVEDSVIEETKTWYAALGYRWDQFVLTIHHEDYEQDPDFGYLSGITHPILSATAIGLEQSLSSTEFDGNGITLRYDFHPSAAFKIDYFAGDHNGEGDYDIFSVGVDLVF